MVCFQINRKSLSISSTVVDYLFVNPCDCHLISPYIINSESHIEVTRLRGNDHLLKKLWIVGLRNSSHQYVGKCMETSMENMNTDIMV